MFEMDFNLKPQPWKANTSLALSIANFQISFSTLILDVIVYKTRKTKAEKRIRKAKRAARRGEALHLSIPKLAFSKIYKCLTSHSDTTVEDYIWWRSWIEHFAATNILTWYNELKKYVWNRRKEIFRWRLFQKLYWYFEMWDLISALSCHPGFLSQIMRTNTTLPSSFSPPTAITIEMSLTTPLSMSLVFPFDILF